MNWLGQTEDKLLLGRMLVRQGLISEAQLADAIARQKETGERLGEILAGWHLLTQGHVQRVLKKQRNLRVILAFASAVFAPLEAMAAAPMPPVEVSTLQKLSEDDLDAVSAAGLQDIIRYQGKVKGEGVEQLQALAGIMHPVLNFLDADTTIKGITYDTANAATTINPDGSIRLSMPSSIGEISLENIRVRGDRSGVSFGSITMKNIDLTGTSITLSAKK